MKNRIIYLILCFLVLGGISQKIRGAKTSRCADGKENIKVFYSPDVKNLSTVWWAEFNELSKENQLELIEIKEPGISEIIDTKTGLGIVSRDFIQPEDWEALWQIVIGREIIVPVFNSENPCFEAIMKQGISPEKMKTFFSGNINKFNLIDAKNAKEVSLYLSNDALVLKSVEKFLAIDKNAIAQNQIVPFKELIRQIQKDVNAIGFCKLTDVYKIDEKQFVSGVSLLPIDLNNNKKLDSFENIYTNFDAFTRGVWVGKYPQSLIRNLYLVAGGAPKGEVQKSFVQWGLNQGQEYMNECGFVALVANEKQFKLDKLADGAEIVTTATGNNYTIIKGILFFIIVILIIGFTIEAVRTHFYKKRLLSKDTFQTNEIINNSNNPLPAGLYFDKSHMWSYMEKNGNIRLGFDSFLSGITGDLTGIILKRPGDTIKRGEPIVSIIQNGKKLTIKSPISGTITEPNQKLVKDPALINIAPYADGWVYLVEPNNWLREIQLMLMADKFTLWLNVEYLRLKDFFALVTPKYEAAPVLAILQEGGEIKKGVLTDFGPKEWEEFQTHFIDGTM
jgi:glycine cleavage system H lipoate-binding protein/ABC-type phosphate transport system substrate-binding protein